MAVERSTPSLDEDDARDEAGTVDSLGPSIGPIRRAFAALEALADGPRTAASLARVLAVNRSTALRLMTELETLGYVRRDPDDKRYSTVPARFYPLIASQIDHADWSEIVDPVLSELRDEFGEAAIMGVPANGTMVYLAFFPSVHLVAVRERLGTTRPMHCSALGKAYLAALEGRALDAELALLTYRGGTQRAARGPMELREKLQRARDRGYAIDRDETFEGGTCVAVPLRIGGSIVGVIGLSGPSHRLGEEHTVTIGDRLVEDLAAIGRRATVTARQVDHGKLIGMSLMAGRDDLETAAATVKDLGFEGTEVHASQLGPGLPGVPVFEGHAAAAGEVVRRAGLFVSTLNVVDDATFDPFGGPDALEATIDGLAAHLRWADAMGAPRVLIYEGRLDDPGKVSAACDTLARVIENAGKRSRLADPVPVSIELHPFTFALRYRALGELGRALLSVGAGICFDFCHFGVALGRDVLDFIDDDALAAIDHIHYSDTDIVTSELHFPPGDGVLDLDAIGARLAGKPIAASWDLFGWPEPRHAVRSGMQTYRAFVERLAASVAD